jgi:hypothetical protein
VTPEQLTASIAEAGIPLDRTDNALDVARVIELLGFAISE